ncbi:hypothetical protein QBC41DRAFT_311070 [Cercophora samala]|uniref:Uncharacterized protein n=1 Tax=Cercophora samala TaxID=330535 RepID=A0AA39ZLY6_9PEZI|nr:hypothetical protein QBC41DRAFT_311070 [Cercophora samala]
MAKPAQKALFDTPGPTTSMEEKTPPTQLSFLALFKYLAQEPILKGGRLNPTHLALSRRLYHFQSKVLHIPDSFGLIGASPEVQARQGLALGYIICIELIVSIMILCRTVWWISKKGWPKDWVAECDILIITGFIALAGFTISCFEMLLLGRVCHRDKGPGFYDEETGNWYAKERRE